MLSMIKIKPFDSTGDSRGVWSIITPISYESHSDIEKLPDVIHFIQKNIGGKYNIQKVGPTGTCWHLIDRENGHFEPTPRR